MVDKVKKVMHEFKHDSLHSGSKTGPKVRSRAQAIAIALSEQRKADQGGYVGGGYVPDPKLADGGEVDRTTVGGTGIVGSASRGIEAVARAVGTEGGRNLNAVDRMMRRPSAGGSAHIARAREPEKREPGGGLDMKIEDAERRSYADGGKVDDDSAKPGEIATTRFGHNRHAEPAYSTRDEAGHARAARENAMFHAQEAHGIDSYEQEAKHRGKTGEYTGASVRRYGAEYRDGGMVQHRHEDTGRYANGGVVHHTKTVTGSKTLSSSVVDRFKDNCKGIVTKFWPNLRT